MHIQSSQDVVQDQNLSPRINSPSERHPRLLSPTQRQSLLSNLGLVSCLEQCQVLAQSTLVDNLAVPDLVEFGTEQDVIADGLVLDPRFLSSVRHTVLPRKIEPRIWPGRDVVQLSEQRHQKGGLSTTGGSNDQVDLSLSEDHFVLNPKAKVSTRGTGSDDSCGLGRPGEGGVANTNKRGVCWHVRSDRILYSGRIEGIKELSLEREVYLSDGTIALRACITYVLKEVANAVKRDLGLDDHRDVIESHPHLVSQRIENYKNGSAHWPELEGSH